MKSSILMVSCLLFALSGMVSAQRIAESNFGTTEDGYPYQGDPDAPVTMYEFSDYLCPFCKRHAAQTTPQIIRDYVDTGKAKLVFVEFPIPSLHPTARYGSVAGTCVLEADPEAYWEYAGAMFDRQGEWNRLPDPTEWLVNLAVEQGMESAFMTGCIDSKRTEPLVDAGIEYAESLGFRGTPSFLLVDEVREREFSFSGALPYQTFASALDSAAAGAVPVTSQQAQKPQLPYWASEEGIAPSDRPGFTEAGDPVKGSDDAPVTVIEFSDFECEPCSDQHIRNMPAIDSTLIDRGRMRWVHKNLPLREHERSLAAAAAVECAGKQDQYWEYKAVLHSDIEFWSTTDSDDPFVQIASGLGLDDSFSSCLGSREGLEMVIQDMYDANQGMPQETPVFLVLKNGMATIIKGARSDSVFRKVADGLR